MACGPPQVGGGLEPGGGHQVRPQVHPAGRGRGEDAGRPPLTRDEWAARVAEWFPQLVDAEARGLTSPAIDAHRDRIDKMLKANRPWTVYQRLRDEHGLRAQTRADCAASTSPVFRIG